MPIGFIGTGNIGTPIAHQLLAAGHPLVIHDARAGAGESLVAAGAGRAGTIAEVAAACEVIHACLPGPPEMEAVVLGDAGLLESARAGGLLIDHTSNAPALARRAQAALAEKGIAMVDAPVSGGVEGARVRDLLVMFGGEAAAIARAQPYLETIAERIIETGAVGSGCVCKILHNAAAFSLDRILAECWTTGVKSGVGADVLVDVFTQGALGRMSNLKVRLRETWLQGEFEARFALALGAKDLGLASALAAEVGVPMEMVALCEADLKEAMARGWGGEDTSKVLLLQEERAGVEVRLPKEEAG